MRITVLIENTSCVPGCEPAHGLSLWIETAQHCLLMDAGPSALLLDNAQRLGVDLARAELLVLSHGHYDHADGIPAFAQLNPKAPIYLRSSAKAACYSGSEADGTLHYIGMDPSVLSLEHLCCMDGTFDISENLSLFGDIAGRRNWPESNLRLSRKSGDHYQQDSFDHEQCLVVRENGKCVLLSGCAHNGILNILDRYQELYHSLPDVVISGFHMKKSAPYTPDEESTIRATAQALLQYPCMFYTCHCTGLPAYHMMKAIMGSKLEYLSCGQTLTL